MKIGSKLIVFTFLVLITCCGKSTDLFDATIPSQVDPYITRVDPVAASAGDTVTIFGIGFSAVPELNIVVVGDSEAAADTYSLLANPSGDEVESLTFTVPADAPIGSQMIYLIVIDNPSNTNNTITIN